MIDEKHIEQFSAIFLEKGYTGEFYTDGVKKTDVKNCLKDYLQNQAVQRPVKEAFPFRLNSFIEGDQSSLHYTLCSFKIDYDQVGGLHLTGMQVFKQAGTETEVLNVSEQLKAWPDIPARDEVLTMDFHEANLPITQDAEIVKAMVKQPLVQAEHLDRFIQALHAKGYTGKFMAPRVPEKELAHTMLTYLNRWPGGIDNVNAFPVWLHTITQGSLITDLRTVCMMRVQYDPEHGFRPDQLRIIRFDARKGTSINEPAPVSLKSLQELPTAQKANALALQNQKTAKKNRRRKL
ncbi:hypothetical protein PV783_24975 [Chitinophaga sp. CC14]|uniref:hypothetical protein n=1 Tax=Chitinophaga sp. CC14 TaxID=3029199 RepID=UPI003B7E478B